MIAANLKSQTCCFTGHRKIQADLQNIVTMRTEITIRNLILKDGIRFFGVGGAFGYDYLCATILLRLRATDFPHIKIILFYPFEGYQSKWTPEQKALYAQIWDKFDKRVCISDIGHNEAFLSRNRHMINHSSILICYFNECQRRSGTGQCVRYAQRCNLKIYNVASDNFLH